VVGLASGVGAPVLLFFRDGMVCNGGKGGGSLSVRLAGGNSGGPFSSLPLLLLPLTLGEVGGAI